MYNIYFNLVLWKDGLNSIDSDDILWNNSKIIYHIYGSVPKWDILLKSMSDLLLKLFKHTMGMMSSKQLKFNLGMVQDTLEHSPR